MSTVGHVEGGQKNLVLILARELASNLATPIFVIDTTGRLIYYNEPGATILGQPFAEVGELPASEWGTRWNPRREDGSPLGLEDLPLTIALRNQRPAHAKFFIDRPDGTTRQISVTGIPLFAKVDEFVGALAIFWESED